MSANPKNHLFLSISTHPPPKQRKDFELSQASARVSSLTDLSNHHKTALAEAVRRAEIAENRTENGGESEKIEGEGGLLGEIEAEK
jgi:hypothetical protein